MSQPFDVRKGKIWRGSSESRESPAPTVTVRETTNEAEVYGDGLRALLQATGTHAVLLGLGVLGGRMSRAPRAGCSSEQAH